VRGTACSATSYFSTVSFYNSVSSGSALSVRVRPMKPIFEAAYGGRRTRCVGVVNNLRRLLNTVALCGELDGYLAPYPTRRSCHKNCDTFYVHVGRSSAPTKSVTLRTNAFRHPLLVRGPRADPVRRYAAPGI
jgi:hypothetical protein